ncbi:hypothetical protein PN4B1_07470 [Paenibacillus naphthalenovorans]|uniref:hypothetical protein n=1 Tax=Paenibacillus naphthalenovorans TaxID=162209 RepID=UPI0010BC3458|nr:hypothetical protein [Paenibacillus naphthalenovorans]GCL70845.1 hypothetical protein PN4B1_07470 [Paenibacillus naphthalenovorans]
MKKGFERIVFTAVAVAVLLILGWVSAVNPDGAMQANPMKVNREQFERIREAAVYVYDGK